MPHLFAVLITAITLLFSVQVSARSTDTSFSTLSSLSSPLLCAEDDKKDDDKKKKDGEEEEEPDCE